jgi:multidrug efflux pump subunit AcrA (membrane-fusion protein)
VARDLPRLQKPARRRLSLGKVLGGCLVAAIVGGVVLFASVPGMSKPVKRLFASSATDVITTEVRSGALPITVTEKGTLESSKNQDAFCKVEGQTTIIEIKPEGTRVKKGELVCLLDSSTLKDNLLNQQITTESAKSNMKNATLTREVAELAVKEYMEGIYKQDLATVLGEIKLAESDLSRSEDRVEWARRMEKKGYISLAAKNSEELALQRARFAKEQAESKLKVLQEYTYDKTVKELKSEVEKARSDELAKKATWDLENTKEKKLVVQIEACEIKAPSDGLVVYANDPNRAFGSNQPQIEEGATVRERQKIFSLPDISKMQVNVKVHESHIYQVKRTMKATIRVDAFSGEPLQGEVVDVAALPDSANFFTSDIKVYTTKVRIDNPLAALRPGMNAEVKIMVDEKANVLSVPVVAVLQFDGKDHVTRRVEDRFVQEEVELGISNESFVEVTKGVKANDIIAMDPITLMTDEEKHKAFGSTGKASVRDWAKRTPGEEAQDAAAVAAAGGDPKAAAPGANGPGAAGKGGGPAGKGGGGQFAKGGGSAKGKRGGGGNNPFAAKFQKLTPEERSSLKTASPEEREQLLKKAGFTDEEIEQMAQMRRNFGGGGGGGGGFGGGGFGGRRGGGGGGGEGGSEQ